MTVFLFRFDFSVVGFRLFVSGREWQRLGLFSRGVYWVSNREYWGEGGCKAVIEVSGGSGGKAWEKKLGEQRARLERDGAGVIKKSCGNVAQLLFKIALTCLQTRVLFSAPLGHTTGALWRGGATRQDTVE